MWLVRCFGLIGDLVHSLSLAELSGGFWGAPMDCMQGLVDAGCPDRMHGNGGVCAGRFSREEGAGGSCGAELPQENCMGGSLLLPWGCSTLPGGAGGHLAPSGAVLPVTWLHGCKEGTATTAPASQQCQWDWDFTGNYAGEVKASKLSYSFPTALLALWLIKGKKKGEKKKGKEVKYSLLVGSLDIAVNT